MKILIVDDEDAARYAMAKALRAEGREILEASNGEVALQSIREQQPDLVFLDLNMPVRDGLSVLSELQGDAAVAQLEIIVVTANESVAQAIECIRRG